MVRESTAWQEPEATKLFLVKVTQIVGSLAALVQLFKLCQFQMKFYVMVSYSVWLQSIVQHAGFCILVTVWHRDKSRLVNF